MASASSSATSTPVLQPKQSPQTISQKGSTQSSPLTLTATASSKIAMETLTLQPTNFTAVLAENEKLKAEVQALKAQVRRLELELTNYNMMPTRVLTFY